MNKYAGKIFCCFLLFTAVSVSSLEPETQSARSRVKEFSYLVYCQQIPLEELKKSYHTNLNMIDLSTLSDSLKNYYRARLHFLMGKAYHHGGDNHIQLIKITLILSEENYTEINYREEADYYYSEGVSAAEKSWNGGAEHSDALRVQALCMGQLCLVRGFRYTMRNGMDVLRSIRQAKKAAPGGGRALLLEAQGKAYPPPLYFGNTLSAMKKLAKAEQCSDLTEEDRFNLILTEAVCHAKKHRKEQALNLLEKALGIYPGNRYAGELKYLLEKDLYSRRELEKFYESR